MLGLNDYQNQHDDPEPIDDQVLQCADCSHDFTFSAGEQRFFAQKALQPPKRCPACRQRRRQEAVERAGGR